jgi:hypothetical protein
VDAVSPEGISARVLATAQALRENLGLRAWAAAAFIGAQTRHEPVA